MRLTCSVFIVLITPAKAWSGSFEQDFAIVFIDEKTEAKFGVIPLNRDVLANGVDAIVNAGAKGLVVKFFLDQSKEEKGDKRLANSFSLIPTVLQARLDNTKNNPNPLADRFTLSFSFNVATAGSSGWIPLPLFANNAADIGFVDFNSTLVPMVEQYQSHFVKSLVLCAIELAAKRKAVFYEGSQIQVGTHVIKLDSKNQATARLISSQFTQSVSFNSVLDGTANEKLKNKVVILAYDGPHIDKFVTILGPMGAHRYFVHVLKSIYDSE